MLVQNLQIDPNVITGNGIKIGTNKANTETTNSSAKYVTEKTET